MISAGMIGRGEVREMIGRDSHEPGEAVAWPRLAQAPLALQILALLIGGMILGQAVTLLLTLVFPPAPPARYGLEDVAAALSGKADSAFERSLDAAPPRMSGPGWLTSDKSRRELAQMLNAREADVLLAFYTPLPFAGAAAPRPPGAMRSDAQPGFRAGFQFLHAIPGGGHPGGPARGPARHDGIRPPGTVPGGMRPGATDGRGPGGRALPPLLGQEAGRSPSAQRYAPLIWGDPAAADRAPPAPVYGPPAAPANPQPAASASAAPARAADSPPAPAASPALWPAVVAILPAPAPPAPSPQAPPRADAPSAPIASAQVREPATGRAPPAVPRALFGLAPAPFVTGDFIAAWRQHDGRWAVVQPVPEPFPNRWQRRVLMWFVMALALVAPLAWLFAQRLVRPLDRFVLAAEQLGRDPSAPVMALAGPAEVGRAAGAFNRMQARLRRFVDDRTAMIGAISHDLRTPLTRMRFRLEEAPDDVRAGMLAEVAEMEDMISSVLIFLRDASDHALRETADLRSILENVVDGTTLVGGKVALEPGERALVDVDAIGIRRVLDNLVDNALKYGARARIRLSTEGGEAITAITDDGPGLPEAELARVFKPFYRGETARASDKQGIGLGLAACRSIARAHGGDVDLVNGDEGLVALLRLPLAS